MKNSDDDYIDDESGRNDDRIMELLVSGNDASLIDHLYCCDGLSVGNIERLVSGSAPHCL